MQAVQAVQPRINDVVYSSNLTHSQAWHGPRPPIQYPFNPHSIHHPPISSGPNTTNHQMTDNKTANRNRTLVAYRLALSLVIDVKRNKYHDASATALLCFALLCSALLCFACLLAYLLACLLALICSGLVWSGLAWLIVSVHQPVGEWPHPEEQALPPR